MALPSFLPRDNVRCGIHDLPHDGAESGQSPHPPHAHIEEEILIVLDGEADIVLSESIADIGARVERIRGLPRVSPSLSASHDSQLPYSAGNISDVQVGGGPFKSGATAR